MTNSPTNNYKVPGNGSTVEAQALLSASQGRKECRQKVTITEEAVTTKQPGFLR